MSIVNLEKYIHLVLIDKDEVITNIVDITPTNIDVAIVLTEAYYQLKDNYTGKSFEDRFKILAKLLNLKTEISFWELASNISNDLRETKLDKYEYMFNYLSFRINKMNDSDFRNLRHKV